MTNCTGLLLVCSTGEPIIHWALGFICFWSLTDIFEVCLTNSYWYLALFPLLPWAGNGNLSQGFSWPRPHSLISELCQHLCECANLPTWACVLVQHNGSWFHCVLVCAHSCCFIILISCMVPPLGLFNDDDMMICYSSSSTPSYIACHAPPITELIFCHCAKMSL